MNKELLQQIIKAVTCDLLRILETSEQTNYQRDDKYSPLTKSSLKVSFHQAPLNDSCPPVVILNKPASLSTTVC